MKVNPGFFVNKAIRLSIDLRYEIVILIKLPK